MDIKEVEKFYDLKTRKQKRKRRKRRNSILSEICKMIFLLIVGFIVLTVLALLSEAAPTTALLAYEFCIVGVILVAVSFWRDKPRRKK